MTKLKGLHVQGPDKISSLLFVLRGQTNALKRTSFSYQEPDSMYHCDSPRINSYNIHKSSQHSVISIYQKTMYNKLFMA